MQRTLIPSLLTIILLFVHSHAFSVTKDTAQNSNSFATGEAFSLHKAMSVIFGNVDEYGRSMQKAESPELPPCFYRELITFSIKTTKEFVINNKDTMYIATSAMPLNSAGGNACPDKSPFIGMSVFEKNDDRWELANTWKFLSRDGHEGPAAVDFVKIGENQVALAINDGGSGKAGYSEWIYLYALIDGEIQCVFNINTYDDNTIVCSLDEGPVDRRSDREGECEYEDNSEVSKPKKCHIFHTKMHIYPFSKFYMYMIKTSTVDHFVWRDKYGIQIPSKVFECYYQFDERLKTYNMVAVEPAGPLFDETSSYKAQGRDVEKGKRESK